MISAAPLFKYLESRGIQQTWLAEQLGCSTQYLTNIKSGHKPVPEWLPERASKILAIPPWMLFDNYSEPLKEEVTT